MPEPKEAKFGEKMIEFRVKFWTNEISEEQGKTEVVPKHAWSSGTVSMVKNDSHGIESSGSEPFHSVMHLPSVIEKLIIEQGIKLHPSNRARKYMEGTLEENGQAE